MTISPPHKINSQGGRTPLQGFYENEGTRVEFERGRVIIAFTLYFQKVFVFFVISAAHILVKFWLACK